MNYLPDFPAIQDLNYAHDHSSLKIKNPPVGFRSNPSSIFVSPARSNVFRLFKQMSVSKDEKIIKKSI